MAGLIRPKTRGPLAVRIVAALVLGSAIAIVAGSGCSSRGPDPRFDTPEERAARPPPRRGGTTHTVRSGENLYRIGKRYGVPAEVIQEANGIGDVTTLSVGQKLWIPPAGSARGGASLQDRVRAEARAEQGIRFRWPVRGKLTSKYGARRGSHEGIDIAAAKGTQVVAAEAGKVVFAARMGDYGKMVVIKHAGNFRSVYAHVRRFHVKKGHFVESGQRIAEVGTTGNASGPHLHFEIRDRDRPRDPMLYLP